MKMKHVLAITVLLLIHALFLRNVIAQDYTQWNLPEGAKARLGKGWIKSISFSPDETQIRILPWLSRLIAKPLQAYTTINVSSYGILTLVKN